MADLHAFNNRRDIERVLRLVNGPQDYFGNSVAYPQKTIPALRSYVAEASRDDGITAAYQSSAGAKQPDCLGKGYVYILERNDQTDCLEYIYDSQGNKVEILTYNYLARTFCQGARFHILQDLPKGDFYILHSKDLSLLESKSCFFPGNTDKEFKLLQFNNGAWVDTGVTVLANDPQGRNCILPGERVWGLPQGSCDGVLRFDLLGENGLDRIAIADENIECEASGDVSLWIHPSITCAQAASGCVVKACNNWGSTHCILAGERIRIRFYETKWQIAPEPINLFFRTSLSSNLCSDDATANISPEDITPLDYCLADPPAIDNVSNSYGLAGCAGDTALIKRNGTNCDDATYELIQVQHHSQRVANGLRFKDCKLELRTTKIAAMSDCCASSTWGCLPTSADPDGNSYCVQMYAHSIVQDVAKTDTTSGSSGGQCKLTKQRETVCLFEQQGSPTAETVITFEAQTVLATVRQKSGAACLEGYVVTAFVACLEGGEYVDLVCGTTCGS